MIIFGDRREKFIFLLTISFRSVTIGLIYSYFLPQCDADDDYADDVDRCYLNRYEDQSKSDEDMWIKLIMT